MIIMKIAIITNSTNYGPRADMTAAFFQNKGHEVIRIESDFVHREKVKRNEWNENTMYIDTIPYSRNLSIQRLYSHYDFAKKTFKLLKGEKLDLIYVFIPANSLMKFTALYKRFHETTKLVVDIIDLWPESLPFRRFKRMWPISLWRDIRNKYLNEADFVITECNLYGRVLRESLKQVDHATIYWPKRFTLKMPEFVEEKEKLNVCYLGSMNHIIDIDFLVHLLVKLKEQGNTVLHMIGDGERRDSLIHQLEEAGISYVYHGTIYEEKKKMEIMSCCEYGLNIMKDSVCVGITMKSVDYMYAGLPMINNIKGDTWDIIENQKIGFNCDADLLGVVAQKVFSQREEMKSKRAFIHQYYTELFSEAAYQRGMEACMKKLLK